MLRPSGNDGDPSPVGPIAGLIGGSPAMLEVYATTRRVAASNASVLLLGETGTGKELIAKAIHELSPRGTGPFVRVNCGALSENLLESELFGHVPDWPPSGHAHGSLMDREMLGETPLIGLPSS
jgi:two-component system response regulator AtoC